MSTHEDFSRNEAVNSSSDRTFALVWGLLFAIVSLWPLLRGKPPRGSTLVISVCFLALGILRPSLLSALHSLVTRIAWSLGKFLNPIVTGLLFYLIFVPMGLLIRLLRKDPLRLARDDGAQSYWILREPPGPEPQTMRDPF